METLKDRLNSAEGQPEQRWNKRKSLSVGERGQTYRVVLKRVYVCSVWDRWRRHQGSSCPEV